MKKFLVVSVLLAVVAYSAVSLASSITGSGTAPSLKIVAINRSEKNNKSTLKIQNFNLKQGQFAFSVLSSADGPHTRFKSTLNFSGPATSADGGSISNVFINMSGLLVGADKAAAAQGALSGTLTHTDSAAKGGASTVLTFSGAYNQKIVLSGFKGTKQNSNPTRGAVAPMDMVITGLFSNSTSIQDVVVSFKPSAIPFKINVQ